MKTVSIPMEELAPILELQLQQGTAALIVTGSSMHPTFRSGKDTVYLRPVTDSLRKGDVILYRRENGQYILHRIVSVPNQGRFVCSGDNQIQPEQVRTEQVAGVVTEFSRAGRRCTVRHPGYRVWVWIWTALFPVRKPFLSVRRVFGYLRRKLRHGR